MPKLGEFIGAMLADAMQARFQADVEAIRLAEIYSRHDLLRHLPVPRFRLPDIVVDLPVLVSGASESAPGGGSPVAPTASELRQVVAQSLKTTGISLPRGEAVRSATVAVDMSKEVFADVTQPLLTHRRIAQDIAGAVTEHVRSVIRTEPSEEQLRALEIEVRSSVSSLILAKLPRAPSLEVVVNSEEIRAHQHSDSVVRLRLTITEDAYEVVAREDDSGFTLTPE